MSSSPQLSTNEKIYDRVVIGGTFDHLHEGHFSLINKALSICKKHLTIGLTGNSMLMNKKFKELIESFETRKKNLLKYLNSVRPELDYFIAELSEPMGPTITDSTLEVIVVSPETISGAEAINKTRIERNMKPLDIVICEIIPNKEGLNPNDSKLSSTSLREKEFKELQKNKL